MKSTIFGNKIGQSTLRKGKKKQKSYIKNLEMIGIKTMDLGLLK